MCHHPILFLLGGLLVAKLIFRARLRRAYGGGCGGRCGGPYDLGAPDRDGRDGRSGRWGRHRHFARWVRRWQGAVPTPRPPVDFGATLELNDRQKELFDDVLAKAKGALPAGEVAETLSLLAREPFDRDAVELLVGRGELADDLEQLHHSLTPEQRGRLRDVTAV